MKEREGKNVGAKHTKKKEKSKSCNDKTSMRTSDLHLVLIILLAPSLVIAPSDITHSRPHFDYRWEPM